MYRTDRNTCYPYVNCLSLILLPFFGEAADLLVKSLLGHLYIIGEIKSESKSLPKAEIQATKSHYTIQQYLQNIRKRLIFKSKNENITSLLTTKGSLLAIDLLFNCFQMISVHHFKNMVTAVIATGSFANILYHRYEEEKLIKKIVKNLVHGTNEQLHRLCICTCI